MKYDPKKPQHRKNLAEVLIHTLNEAGFKEEDSDYHEMLYSRIVKDTGCKIIVFSSIDKNTKVRLELKTLIDPLGRSIKPIQIKSWLNHYFDINFEIENIKRDELQLY